MVENWVKVGEEKDFADGLRPLTVGKERIVVGRVNGRLFAFDGLCPHAQGPMVRAEIDGFVVSCPLHAWRFDLEKGGKELHGYRDLPVKPVKVEDGAVYVAM